MILFAVPHAVKKYKSALSSMKASLYSNLVSCIQDAEAWTSAISAVETSNIYI